MDLGAHSWGWMGTGWVLDGYWMGTGWGRSLVWICGVDPACGSDDCHVDMACGSGVDVHACSGGNSVPFGNVRPARRLVGASNNRTHSGAM